MAQRRTTEAKQMLRAHADTNRAGLAALLPSRRHGRTTRFCWSLTRAPASSMLLYPRDNTVLNAGVHAVARISCLVGHDGIQHDRIPHEPPEANLAQGALRMCHPYANDYGADLISASFAEPSPRTRTPCGATTRNLVPRRATPSRPQLRRPRDSVSSQRRFPKHLGPLSRHRHRRCNNPSMALRHAPRHFATITQTRPPGCVSRRARGPAQRHHQLASASSQEEILVLFHTDSAQRAVLCG